MTKPTDQDRKSNTLNTLDTDYLKTLSSVPKIEQEKTVKKKSLD